MTSLFSFMFLYTSVDYTIFLFFFIFFRKLLFIFKHFNYKYQEYRTRLLFAEARYLFIQILLRHREKNIILELLNSPEFLLTKLSML